MQYVEKDGNGAGLSRVIIPGEEFQDVEMTQDEQEKGEDTGIDGWRDEDMVLSKILCLSSKILMTSVLVPDSPFGNPVTPSPSPTLPHSASTDTISTSRLHTTRSPVPSNTPLNIKLFPANRITDSGPVATIIYPPRPTVLEEPASDETLQSGSTANGGRSSSTPPPCCSILL